MALDTGYPASHVTWNMIHLPAEQIAAIISECASKHLARVDITRAHRTQLPSESLRVHIGPAEFRLLCRAIADDAMLIITAPRPTPPRPTPDDVDESDGVPLPSLNFDTDVTQDATLSAPCCEVYR